MRHHRTSPAISGNATLGIAGTIVVHAAAIGLMWFTVKPATNFPPVYAVNLVAAPLPRPDTRPAPQAVERPADPTPPAVPTTTRKPVAETPRPAPPRTQAPPEKREPAPRTQSPTPPAPGETPGTGTDAVTIKTPGLTFPYPGYLENIINQIYRRWDRPVGSRLRAEVTFLLMRDGSVRDLKFSTSSGNFSFDLSAQGAVEAAANAGAFGPLPDGYEADVLLVSFFFAPSAGR
ncbi:MAG TPA: TonB C-terminal domain-containing protein [Gemmatimonadales bacterium]|jgi:outer membrane biosynthesis protein TonB|nr:TonB C-terminal domain-containing protein [Gemmatimonadales bacterium]